MDIIRKFKAPRPETIIHLIIGEIVVNLIWWGITEWLTIKSEARDWGFVILSALVVIVIGWYLGRRYKLTIPPLKKTNGENTSQTQTPQLQEPTPQVSEEVQQYAHWWLTAVDDDRKRLQDLVCIYSRSVDWHHLTKKSVAQTCYLDFIFDIYGGSILTMTIGRKPPTGKVKFNGQEQANEVTLPVSTPMHIRRGTTGQLIVRQTVARDAAFDIWQARFRKEMPQVNLDFAEVRIPLETILPDGKPGPESMLRLPPAWDVAIPSVEELGEWKH